MKKTKSLRQRSGCVDSADPLVNFLYVLMRDHLPPGVVAEIVNRQQASVSQYSNGWLARYAADVAARLK